MNWLDHAACKGLPPELFFPNNGRDREALRVCAGCPVLPECRDEALSYEDWEDQGVRGGLFASQRRQIRAERRHDAERLRLWWIRLDRYRESIQVLAVAA